MLSNIKSRQTLKLVIYILLLINFVLYIIDDIRIASYTLQEDASFLDWTQSFATTIDESAWLILLFLFELETYMLSDEAWSKTLFTRFWVACWCHSQLGQSQFKPRSFWEKRNPLFPKEPRLGLPLS